MYGLINDFTKLKVYDYLKKNPFGKALFNFQHGLGDVINFLPLVMELKKHFPKVSFKIGYDFRKGYSFLGDLSYPMNTTGKDFREVLRNFSYIFVIQYMEPKTVNYTCKPYLCNEREIGIPDFKWEPFMFNLERKEESDLVGVHFFGNTNSDFKNPHIDCIKIILNEIEEYGYQPFEIHMIHDVARQKSIDNGRCDLFSRENSLRFEKPSIERMMEKIRECKYFIGIDSGPLYLSGSILGLNKVVGIQKYLEIARYLPVKIPIVDIRYYKPGSIKKCLKELDYED